MSKLMWRARQSLFFQLACVVAAGLLWPVSAGADTTYYVDPDWTGAKTGAAATPWSSLTSAAWTTINAALASGHVTVYFSAREAGSDINETTTAYLAVLRTNGSAYRLTLSGNQKYNVIDASPSWVDYTGTSKFQITSSVPVTTGSLARSDITLHGFRLISTNGGQIIYWYGGHNVIWEDNEASDTSSGPGPGLYFEYTHYSGVAYTNLTIRRNYVHDTNGECIYIGGCDDDDHCLSHDGVLIENNTVGPNCGIYGGDADAIDIKDGLRNVVVRGNTIVLQTNSRAGICTESGALIERNYIENAGVYGIQFSVYWNNAGPTRAGSVARNNVLVNSGGATSGDGNHYGVYMDSGAGTKAGGANDQFADLKIYNNTIYRVLGAGSGKSGTGISVGAPGTTVTNNIVMDAVTLQLSAPSGYLAAHSNNLFYSSTSGATVVRSGSSSYTRSTIKSFEATGLSVNPMFVSTATPDGVKSFRLQSTSPARAAGVVIDSFPDDFFGMPRGSTWDMGAVQYSDVALAPRPPTGLQIIRD